MWPFSNKTFISESGPLEGFRDCHCHLLPGVDDGVTELDETMQILGEWERNGVKEVWLTPHIMEDIPNKPSELRERFEKLTANYAGKIELHLAAEHMMDGLFIKRLETNDVQPIGKDKSRLLVETSYYTPPMNMGDLIDRIAAKGYEPILAHPERYRYMDLPDYKRWKQKGLLLQMNVPSLVGAYGPEVQWKAEWLLKENMYDYCGSDTHSIEHVEFLLNSKINKNTVKKVKKIAEGQKL
jgi:tyrosine-protein phosphatase YwqE